MDFDFMASNSNMYRAWYFSLAMGSIIRIAFWVIYFMAAASVKGCYVRKICSFFLENGLEARKNELELIDELCSN